MLKANANLGTAVFVAVLITSTICIPCVAQATRINADDLMDSAFDMKKSAERADKLASDGSKYCGWGIASIDASDLSDAISRFLLSHGSSVPETVLASKMWRVSFVAKDLTNQLEMGLEQ